MSEFLVPPASKRDIKRLALTIRKKFGLEHNALFPVVEMIEVVLPVFDPQFNFEIVEDCECGLDEANYDPRHNLMRIRQSVYDGAYNCNGRDRFTLAHELGHYFMQMCWPATLNYNKLELNVYRLFYSGQGQHLDA